MPAKAAAPARAAAMMVTPAADEKPSIGGFLAGGRQVSLVEARNKTSRRPKERGLDARRLERYAIPR